MTAPARSTSTRAVPKRERLGRDGQRGAERVGGARALDTPPRRDKQDTGLRGRSAAAERAYARRAHRRDRWLRVVPERWPDAAAQTPFVLTVMALLGSGLVATLWLSTAAISDSYRLEEARKQVQMLSNQQAQLRAEIAQQESASSLAQRAREMGLVRPDTPAHLVVKPDGSTAVVGDPKPAQAPPPPSPTPTPSNSPADQPPAAPDGQAPTSQASPPGQQPSSSQQPTPGGG